MKKAKLILAGIACMAVVGGAFAVKASNNAARGKVVFYNTTSTLPCTITLLNYYTSAIGIVTFASTTTTAAFCPRATITTAP